MVVLDLNHIACFQGPVRHGYCTAQGCLHYLIGFSHQVNPEMVIDRTEFAGDDSLHRCEKMQFMKLFIYLSIFQDTEPELLFCFYLLS